MLENQNEQPSSTPAELAEPLPSPETTAFANTVTLRAIEAALSATQSDRMRLNASFITYLDRVVVVAGGALAFVFTVVANLSVQLHSIHLSALHPGFVIVSCWLFVACIITALFAGWLALKVQGFAALDATVLHVERAVTGASWTNIPRSILPRFPASYLLSITNPNFDDMDSSQQL